MLRNIIWDQLSFGTFNAFSKTSTALAARPQLLWKPAPPAPTNELCKYIRLTIIVYHQADAKHFGLHTRSSTPAGPEAYSMADNIQFFKPLPLRQFRRESDTSESDSFCECEINLSRPADVINSVQSWLLTNCSLDGILPESCLLQQGEE
jgi:hypothetical protein